MHTTSLSIALLSTYRSSAIPSLSIALLNTYRSSAIPSLSIALLNTWYTYVPLISEATHYKMRLGFLFLLLSCALVSSSPAVASDVPIRDTNGNPLRRGEPYYVLAVDRGDGVNVGTIDGSCPRDVWIRGGPPAEPVMFFPNDTTHGRTVLREELLLIMFAELLPCPGSTLWMVNDTTGVVTTGGVSPSASDSTYNYYGYFRIDSYDILGPEYYRIYSCPTPLEQRPCSTIGMTPVGGIRRFNFPLIVQFQKVPADKLKKMPRQLLMPPTA